VTTTTSSSPLKTTPSLGYGDYLRFSQLVYERCGLHFPDKRRDDLERGVRHAFAASTCTGLDEFYHLLRNSDSAAVHFERLVNAITISETHFFRDTGQFDALYSHVFPQLIRRRQALRTLRIWSAGCASGEEPYSIAMLLRELLPDVEDWSITILGTDINTEALDRARQAVYSEWAFREERAKQWRSRYFRRRGNHYELNSVVKQMVTFAQLNLVEDEYPSYGSNTTLMDLILCRNVMIYLTESISQHIVERFHDCLTPGGWLVVGHAEHSLTIYRRFQLHNFPNAILYQRDENFYSLKDQGGPIPSSAQDRKRKRRKERFNRSFIPAPRSDDFIPSSPIPTHGVDGVQDTNEPESERVPEPDERVHAQPSRGSDCQTNPREGDTSPPATAKGDEHVYIHALGRIGHVDPFERAKELLTYGRSEEGRDLLLELAATEPAHVPTCTLLGQAYANLGNWEEAEQWCRQAIRLDKLALDAYYTLALVLQHQERIDQAVEAMRKVIYIDRHNVLGHFGLAELYYSSSQLPQALKSLDNARRLLDGCADDEFIPGSGGITAGRLRETVIRQQQQWSAIASEIWGNKQ